MWSYTNRKYCNSAVTLTLSTNHSNHQSIDDHYSLKLEIEGGETSSYSKVKFRLNKVETVQLLKSLIDCELDKVKDKVHVPIFSVERLGVKYLVEFVRNYYDETEGNEAESKEEYIGWDFKVAVYTDEMIGDCSVELNFKFTEHGDSAEHELTRISEFATPALKQIQKESVKAELK